MKNILMGMAVLIPVIAISFLFTKPMAALVLSIVALVLTIAVCWIVGECVKILFDL